MKIFFTAAHNQLAQHAMVELTTRYGQATCDNCDVIVALGGDGHVMKTLYDGLGHNIPVFPMRRTESVGFLCNDFQNADLPQQISTATKVTLHPLHVRATTTDNNVTEALAFNEVGIIRETPQSARLRISVDGVERIEKYSGDGVLVSTPAGSTAYNHSCGGPIMPLDANTLVMTAISGYRPRGWRYAVLPQSVNVVVEALETSKRPVRIEAGNKTIPNAARASIFLDRNMQVTLLFTPDAHLGERIVREQFLLE